MVMMKKRYKPMHFYPKQRKRIALKDTAKKKVNN